jgi:hypothetical protein
MKQGKRKFINLQRNRSHENSLLVKKPSEKLYEELASIESSGYCRKQATRS